MPGPWRALPVAHAAGFLSHLGPLLAQASGHPQVLAPGQGNGGTLRAMPLSFYPGWALIEGEAALAPDTIGTFDVLYGPGLMWLIDGDARVLNDLNGGRLPLDIEGYRERSRIDGPFMPSPLGPFDTVRSGPDFLRFFCASVWGDEGPFMLVESADSPVLRGVDARNLDWAGEIAPLAVYLDGSDLVGEGLVAYGRSLYRARLRVRDGRVGMEDDTPVAADALPERRNRSPLRDLRATGNGDSRIIAGGNDR
ncbi:MAG: hypothetical protein BGO72_16045 [Burkholderiales bacterium 70-64]|nr:MAG: hypothetical protein BGO72_16045 [Burkholderiales bacterium 70-64]